jgi:hypothetical protein
MQLQTQTSVSGVYDVIVFSIQCYETLGVGVSPVSYVQLLQAIFVCLTSLTLQCVTKCSACIDNVC